MHTTFPNLQYFQKVVLLLNHDKLAICMKFPQHQILAFQIFLTINTFISPWNFANNMIKRCSSRTNINIIAITLSSKKVKWKRQIRIKMTESDKELHVSYILVFHRFYHWRPIILKLYIQQLKSLTQLTKQLALAKQTNERMNE